MEACGGLFTSANPPWPLPIFDARSWAAFKKSQEYRGYVHIPSVIFQVRNDRIVGRVQLLGQSEDSYGFTKLAKTPIDSGIKDPADPYRPWLNSPKNPFRRENFTIHQNATKIVLRSWMAARLGQRERELNYKWFGLDAPFIYLDVTETIRINGSQVTITLQIKHSAFPSTNLYVNDRLVWPPYTQANLADFMRHGGNILHAPGVGPLAPAGPIVTWSN